MNNPNFNNSLPPSPKNPAKTISTAYRAQSLAVRDNKTADPRLFVNALQPWIDSCSLNNSYWRPVSKAMKIPPSLKPTQYGWSFRKYAPISSDEFSRNAADPTNIYLLRMADVYLLYAEANINAGDNVTGLEYINKVKRRAYGYPINGVSPVDYRSLSGATSATDPKLKNSPLYYERWAELFNEGHWWFDVCRWRLGSSEASFFESTIVNGPLHWNDKSYSWPIPNYEIITNPNIQQNPGY